MRCGSNCSPKGEYRGSRLRRSGEIFRCTVKLIPLNHRRKRILRSSVVLRRPSGFIEPCQPSKVARPPSGPLWVHEIKHDGYRLMVRRDGSRVRCFTRNGHDWADHFTGIVDAASRIKATSFLIDGEVVITSDDGMSDFRALRSKRRGHEAVLFAFDLIEHDGTLRPATDRAQAAAGQADRQGQAAIDPVRSASDG